MCGQCGRLCTHLLTDVPRFIHEGERTHIGKSWRIRIYLQVQEIQYDTVQHITLQYTTMWNASNTPTCTNAHASAITHTYTHTSATTHSDTYTVTHTRAITTIIQQNSFHFNGGSLAVDTHVR